MPKDIVESYVRYLEWNRQNNGRLYYILWALFIGGFVYTFKLKAVDSCILHLGLVLFRLLAIAGSILNFHYQETGIDSLGKLREQIFQDDSHKWEMEQPELIGSTIPHEQHSPTCLNEAHFAKARSLELEVKQLDARGRSLQICLHSVTYVYLVLALALSFLLYPV